jgi:hypothetical protein
VVPTMNTSVVPTSSAQVFRAIVSVDDTGLAALDQKPVYFIVPPAR